MEWGIPLGKYHRSYFLTSATKLLPSRSMAVIRAVPLSMIAHSPAVCQCSSRTPPAVSLMFTPARVLETGSSRTVTSLDHPPSYVRLFANENGYLKFCTRLLESVAGGQAESAFCASSGGFPGPGSLLLLSAAIAGRIPAAVSAAAGAS